MSVIRKIATDAMAECLPHPCDGKKYRDRTVDDQARKVAEEHYEAVEALGEYRADPCEENRIALGMELTDLITAVTGELEKLGFQLPDRMALQHAVNMRNKARGRFCEDD